MNDRTYATKDTNEALTLRMAGIIELEEPAAVHRAGKARAEWTFYFADSQRREQISNAYFAQFSSRRPLNLREEDVAAAIADFVRTRKEFLSTTETLREIRG
jgi:hypothetical protein